MERRTLGEIWHEEAERENPLAAFCVFAIAVLAITFSILLLPATAEAEELTADIPVALPDETGTDETGTDETGIIKTVVSDISKRVAKEKQRKQEAEKADKLLEKAKKVKKTGMEKGKKAIEYAKKDKVEKARKALEKAKAKLSKLKGYSKKARKLKTQEKKYGKICDLRDDLSDRIDLAKIKIKEAKQRIKAKKEADARHSRMAASLQHNGTVCSGGYKYTWYSQRVLPGGGLKIPGRHVGLAGMIMDGSGRVCVASSTHSWGTVLSTPFGTARVYDSGCPYGIIDVYTNW